MQTTSITFTAPNINALRAQMTSFLGTEETTIVSTGTTPSPKKKAKPEIEDEFDIDGDVSESDDETEVAPEENDEVTLDDVTEAFRVFAKRREGNKDRAKKVLQTLGVKSVRDLKPNQYKKAMSMVA
jgi:hypothetical protein